MGPGAEAEAAHALASHLTPCRLDAALRRSSRLPEMGPALDASDPGRAMEHGTMGVEVVETDLEGLQASGLGSGFSDAEDMQAVSG